jgi:hypothetical protein
VALPGVLRGKVPLLMRWTVMHEGLLLAVYPGGSASLVKEGKRWRLTATRGRSEFTAYIGRGANVTKRTAALLEEWGFESACD